MKLKPIPAVLAVAVLVLLALFILDATIDEQRNDALARKALAAGQAWRATVTRERQASAVNHQRQASELRRLTSALTVANALRDSVSRADTLPPPALTDTVALHWFTLYRWQVSRSDSLASALDASQAAFLLARQDAARAWRTVESGVEASRLMEDALRQKQCRVLFVPCPGRSWFFVGGLVVGFVLARKAL